MVIVVLMVRMMILIVAITRITNYSNGDQKCGTHVNDNDKMKSSTSNNDNNSDEKNNSSDSRINDESSQYVYACKLCHLRVYIKCIYVPSSVPYVLKVVELSVACVIFIWLKSLQQLCAAWPWSSPQESLCGPSSISCNGQITA